MIICGLLGALRSECSRQRVRASKLALPLAADPRRLCILSKQLDIYNGFHYNMTHDKNF